MGIAPWDYTFWQLVLMRTGREKECWDRLAFQLANQGGFAGMKKPNIKDFHKFLMESPTLNKKKMQGLKGMFNKTETIDAKNVATPADNIEVGQEKRDD